MVIVGVAAISLSAPSSASAVTGCQVGVGGDGYDSWAWSKCDTSAPGIYFRTWIHCKHVDPYGRVNYYYRYSQWDYQGPSNYYPRVNGALWAYCDSGDVYSWYGVSYPAGVQTS